MNPQDPTIALLHEHVAVMLLAPVFVFLGLAACFIAALRRRGEFRLLVWFGLFIGMYGARMLADEAALLGWSPQSPWPAQISIVVQFLLVIPALLFWIELSTGVVRRTFQLLAVTTSGIAAIGLGWFFISGSRSTFLRCNLLLSIFAVILIGVLVSIPRVANKYLVIRSRTLRYVMPAVALVTLYVNAMWFLGKPPSPYVEPVAFAAWVLAIGMEAAKNTFDKERRLFSIESELETARQIQSSILPDRVPAVSGLRIAASYNPMSAVAGDFYQFLQVDDHRIGILVADVSGHGVPAALIASMIKVAMQSVAASAPDPGIVMSSLNRILTHELRGQLTSAGYLWIDTEEKCARYSAAGHPALLEWSSTRNELLHIESNGLLFGVTDESEYPVRKLAIVPGDRFMLYTDGLIEPENAHGEAFGDRQLERTLSEGRSMTARELSGQLLASLREWQPAPAAQQDDITLVVVDVV